MIRRFLFNRAASHESEEGFSTVLPLANIPPTMAFQAEEKQKKSDSNAAHVEDLAPFDACIEACDQLASTSTSSGRYDPSTGLMDCSVLVSADGDLLIIPRKQQNRSDNEETTERPQNLRSQSFLQRNVSELGAEYSSAIFMGSDLNTAGDKALNGFSAKGWSIPAGSLAMRQSADVMADLADFVEDLVLSKKSCAAQESQMVHGLRPLVEGPERGGLRVQQYQGY
jgi:hypothetical protein